MPSGSSPHSSADPFAAHAGLALMLAGKYRRHPGLDDADVRQEALLALAEALKLYDPDEHGGTLGGFVFWRIRGRLSNLCRRWRLRPDRTRTRVEDLALADRGQDPAGFAELRDVWRVAGEVLTPRQARVLTLLAQGFTTHEIAQALGICQATVRGTKRAAFVRLRQALG